MAGPIGDTKFRTLRIDCLALENLQTGDFTQIPWSEADVREHLNKMRSEEASSTQDPTSVGDIAMVLKEVWFPQD